MLSGNVRLVPAYGLAHQTNPIGAHPTRMVSNETMPGYIDFALFIHPAQYAEYRYCALPSSESALRVQAIQHKIVRILG